MDGSGMDGSWGLNWDDLLEMVFSIEGIDCGYCCSFLGSLSTMPTSSTSRVASIHSHSAC
jgi:hypothetical protein